MLRQPLPPGTKRLLILDEPIARLFPAGSLEARKITGKRYVWLWPAIPRDEELSLLTVPTYISVD